VGGVKAGMDKLLLPEFYSSMDYNQVKNEIRKLMECELPSHEVKKRLVSLETQLLRRYR
jgi:hypothetical protein